MSTSSANTLSTAGSAAKEPAKFFGDIMKYIANAKEKFIIYFISVMIIIIIIMALIYYYMEKSYISRNCKTMDDLYAEKNLKIQNINPSDPDASYTLKDYYIKTAYNCCSIGSYKNSFVSNCIFKDLVRQGVRGFDFEIYSINDQPVVATSTEDDNYYIKETYNYVSFSDIMDIITNTSYAPNPTDPVIFHLRIKSTNQTMYQNFASLFKKYDSFFLGPDYSFENKLKNIGDISLLELKGSSTCKIVIIVDKTNTSFMDCKEFYEYVNMTSNSIFMRALRYYDVKNTPDMVELIEYNKRFMTIAMPDKGPKPANPNPISCREMGCQLIAMNYTNFDEYLAADCAFYDHTGSAFELKPERLRYKQIYIDDPVPQNPANSYETRNVSSDYYQFDI
uniref:PI-PLC Y-box domain-containing protein n=1 Tax=viral metagenome TaxID=1070528 RepID=A0A6C0KW40_9ZZZZ